METGRRRMVRRAVPWREDVTWWVPFVEGIAAITVAVILLVWEEESARVILWSLGGFLLAISVAWAYAGLRSTDDAAARPAKLVQAGVGLIVGLLVVTQPVVEMMTREAAFITLAVGLVVAGVIGLFDGIQRRLAGAGEPLLFAVLAVALGGLLIYAVVADAPLLRWTGWLLAGIGALLLAYSVTLFMRRRPRSAAPVSP